MGDSKFSRSISMFDSHEEADQANALYYKELSTTERLEIALQLMASVYEAHQGFERIYRTAELGECPVSSDWGLGPKSIR